MTSRLLKKRMQSFLRVAHKLAKVPDSKIIIKPFNSTKLQPLAVSNYRLLNWNDLPLDFDSLKIARSRHSSSILQNNRKQKKRTGAKEIEYGTSQLKQKYRTLNSVYFRIIPKAKDSKYYQYEMLREHKLKYTLHSTQVLFGNPPFEEFAEKRFDRIENDLEDKRHKYRINHQLQYEKLLNTTEPLPSIPSPNGNLKLKYLKSNQTSKQWKSIFTIRNLTPQIE